MLKIVTMNTDKLLYFREAARYQHLAKASKVLNISISSISHAIRGLEEELGCSLFQKRGKNIYLTEKGRLLEEKADHLFKHLDEIKNLIQTNDVNWKGHFRVGATPGLDAIFFLPEWSKFQKSFPELVIEFSTNRSSTIVELIAKSELDFGVCFDPVDNPLIETKLLMKTPHLITVRKGHPLLRRKSDRSNFKIEEVSKFSCCSPITYPGIEMCKQHSILKEKNINPKIEFIFESYISAAYRVKSTNSWCYLPELFAQKLGLEQIRIKGFNLEVALKLIWPASRPLPSSIRSFVNKNLNLV